MFRSCFGFCGCLGSQYSVHLPLSRTTSLRFPHLDRTQSHHRVPAERPPRLSAFCPTSFSFPLSGKTFFVFMLAGLGLGRVVDGAGGRSSESDSEASRSGGNLMGGSCGNAVSGPF